MKRSLVVLLLCLQALAGASKPKKNLVRVPVFVTARGEPQARELGPKDFSATIDGQPTRVLAAHGPGDGLIVLLVMDVSEELSLVDIAKDALVEAIRQLPPQALVGVLRAQDGLRVLVDPTTDRAALEQAIRNVPVTGKAGLLDTVETASRIVNGMLTKADVRVALVYVTDSSIGNYRDDYTNPVVNWSDSHDMSRRFPEGLIKEKISRLDSKLSRLDSPLFVVHLDYRSDRLNEAYQAGLMQLSSTSGGASVFCRSLTEIPNAITGIFRSIASHYMLDVQVPERASKSIQVQLETDGRTLSYRNRFVFEEK